MDDFTLLQNYAKARCQQSFAQLVSRYVNLVYSAALRQLRDHHQAEEVTQVVFIVLAKKACSIGANVLLSGWLLQTTSYAVRNLLRADQRRKRHERKAAQMNPAIENDDAKARAWEQIVPLLDEGIRKLPAKARDAVILRYLEERSSEEVAQRLGISEQAARQRVSRAVELLREHFLRRGVAVPVALIATLLAEQTTHAAPAGLAASSAALASAATPLSNGVLTMILIGKIKAAAAIVVGVCLFAAAATAVLQAAAPRATPAAPPVAAPVADANPAEMEIAGIVIKPDGQPFSDGEVFLADIDHPVCIYTDDLPKTIMVLRDGGEPMATYFDRKPANKVKTVTGADGRFSFTVPLPPSKQPRKPTALLPPAKVGGALTTPRDPGWKADPIYQIVVRADEGFAQVFVDDLPKSREILLRPWGKIEGTFTISGKPKAGENLYLSRWPRLDDKSLMQVVHDMTLRTDANGHFSIPRIAPGDTWITRRLRPQVAAVTHFAYVDVKPGETAQVELGGGRTVNGNLVEPKDSPERILWQDTWTWTEGELKSLPDHAFERPADWYNLTASQQHARMEEWGRSKEGQAYKQTLFNRTFLVNPDGAFTIPDLPPGQYAMKINTTQGPGLSESVASLERTLDVPNAADPLDLGALEVKLHPRLHIGDVAPRFECRTLAGEPLKLDAFNGKYILLYFCQTPMEEKLNYLKDLQAIRTAYATDNRLAIIALHTDADIETARKLVQNKNLTWPQGYIGENSKIQSDYHATGAMVFLIGPDGKVIGRHLDKEMLDRAVSAALGKPGK